MRARSRPLCCQELPLVDMTIRFDYLSNYPLAKTLSDLTEMEKIIVKAIGMQRAAPEQLVCQIDIMCNNLRSVAHFQWLMVPREYGVEARFEIFHLIDVRCNAIINWLQLVAQFPCTPYFL